MKGEAAAGQQFVRRRRVILHLPLFIVPDNGRAAQTFQNADLNFLRPESNKLVKSAPETREILTGQADNEIGVDVNAGLPAQEAEIFGKLIVILAALDPGTDLGV